MSYQQLHAGKVKLNGLAGIRHHLLDRERVKTNPDIDLSRSNLNHSIENLSPDNLIRNVRQRIKQLNLKRKPRIDAVGLEDIIVGASTDFMLQLGTDKREQYFTDALHFFQNQYGKENVMYCHCHLDESNPHIHIGVVPVTSDGRLSARDVFNPKTLEKLQTDFHFTVAQHYGLERGEHTARNYLELNQFKVQQTKQEILQYSHDLDTFHCTQANIEKINSNSHYSSTGFIIKSEDKNNTVLSTSDFTELIKIAQDGAKAIALIHLLQEQNQQLQRENLKAISDYDYILHQLNQLEEETANYTAVPKFWRKHIDSSIAQFQETFTRYCHDINRATIRVFFATHGDFSKTENVMRTSLQKLGVKNVKNHIANTLKAAKKQFTKNSTPDLPMNAPSWNPPKPSETDYSQPCNPQALDFADASKLVDLSFDSIDWDLINWNMLSVFDKAEIQRQKMIREL